VDGEVSVGERFRVGSAELIVTEPRLPCLKLGIKMGRDEFVTEFLERGLLGLYLAVVQEGGVEADDPIVELSRDPRGFTVTEVTRLYARDRDDVEGLRRAVELDVLPDSWRNYFRKRLPTSSASGKPPPLGPATRQLASRARRRVRGAPVPDADLAVQWEGVEAFLAATHDGDLDALVAVLDPHVVLRGDAAHRPLAARQGRKGRRRPGVLLVPDRPDDATRPGQRRARNRLDS
jgi:3-alpha domain/MOSC domain